MRTILLPASLLAILCLGACVDHSGSVDAVDTQGPPPISNPDPTTVGNPDPGQTGNAGEPGRGGSSNPNPGSNPGKGDPPQGGQPVPEPSTMLLVGTGLAGLALLRRRRQQKQ